MLRRTILKSSITLIMVVGTAAALSLLTAGTGSAAPAAPAHAVAQAAPAVPANPTSVRCTTPGHANPCWATTENARDGGPWGCSYPIGVPLFLRSGGVRCFGGNDLVEISCYYQGSPVAYGDNYEDHVFLEDAGRTADVGHIPDWFVNLGGHNPPQVNIPLC
jgi:hypothetical protein